MNIVFGGFHFIGKQALRGKGLIRRLELLGP